MPEEPLLKKQVTTVMYKAKNGEVKELRIVQAMDPDQKIFTLADIQLLAKEISKQLRLDAF